MKYFALFFAFFVSDSYQAYHVSPTLTHCQWAIDGLFNALFSHEVWDPNKVFALAEFALSAPTFLKEMPQPANIG